MQPGLAHALAWGVGTFVVALGLQWTLWRLLAVRREMLALALLMLLLPTAALGALALAAPPQWRLPAADAALAWLLCMALSSAWIQTYPALREDIPSFRLLFALDAAGLAGASAAQLHEAMRRGPALAASKMEDLQRDGLMVRRADGRLVLRPAGLWLARFFRLYRQALGLPTGLG